LSEVLMLLTGLEVVRSQGFAPLAGKRVGLFTNPSAVDRALNSTLNILWHAPQVKLAALFSPEHGLTATAGDGEHVHSSLDTRTGLPVHSLYGASLHPTADMFEGLDVIVCDIQDIGSRYYTFAWTISHLLEGAGEQGIPVILLDRPNPLGNRLDGPCLEMRFSSLVGRFPVPVQHGMTLGELMQMVNDRWNPTPAQLTIIPCQDYDRTIPWEATGLPFVSPSPAMPHLITVRHYPGSCLIEGTTLSEGRGTALPFEVVGAPYINNEHLAAYLNAQNLAGVRFRPHTFKPFASKYTGEVCAGIQAYIMNLTIYQPLATWLNVIRSIRQLYPADFRWNERHFDRLIGNDWIRQQIETDEPLQAWQTDCENFAELRKPYLIYR
jgi:uncharacterized protein YbbC (DUF1343 family)